MTANRRAELQRKLAVAPVEQPPAGLSARIKNEIPKELRFNAEGERKRIAQTTRISLAVAASVVVVIATAYLALQETTIRTDIEHAKPAAGSAAVRDRALPQAPAPKPAIIAEEPQKTTKALERHARKQQNAPIPVVAEAPAVQQQIAVGGQVADAKDAAAAKEVATDEVRNVAAQAAPARAASTVAAAAPPVSEVKTEATRSPVSGKVMVVRGTEVLDAASLPAREETLKKWKDISREAKIQILKAELARGAEPGEVARVAREAGLDEFADSIEKKQQH